MAVKQQVIKDNYALYCGDCIEVLPTLPEASVGFCVFSPPFAELYVFSDDPRDMSNNDYAGFFEHFDFLVGLLKKVMMPGRIVAVHCMDVPSYKRNGEEIGLKDFPGDIVRCFQKQGFIYHSRHCIWKDPLIAATRTKAIGLAHKQLVKDSVYSRMGIPDYILAFRKEGENTVPIKHEHGLIEYHGSKVVPPLRELKDDGYDSTKDRRSQWIWQQYASPVWMDIRQTRVLKNFRHAKESEDGKHISPLQLDVVERCIELWSAPGDVVLTPFGGIGTEAFVAVKNGRKAVLIELKKSYFNQAAINVESAENKATQNTMLEA